MDSEWESNNYKMFHALSMQNIKGTSYTETFIAISPLFLSVFLTVFYSFINNTSRPFNFYNFCFDFFIIVFLAILCFTVLSNSIPLVVVILCVISFVMLLSHVIVHRNIYFKSGLADVWTTQLSVLKKPYVTNFRALTNVLSAICILAVDFKVFPRRFAKTETFGYSLMDTGVGLYCIANSIVSPEVLYCNKKSSDSRLQSFLTSLKTCLTLILLGMIRLYFTKETDYNVIVTEYGVHWNFFITLAVTKLLSSLILAIFGIKYSFLLSFLIISIHECILQFSLQEWVLSDAPRETLFSANREGVVSSLGYIALYLSGVSLGYMLRYTSMTFKEKVIINLKLFGLTVLLWTCVTLSQYYLPISRRLANAGYCLWILTFSITTLAIFLLMELLIHALHFKRKGSAQSEVCVPVLLEAVNYNGLVFFLLANLITGLVNLCIKTLLIGPILCIFIITIYMFVLCLSTFILYQRGLKLKL